MFTQVVLESEGEGAMSLSRNLGWSQGFSISWGPMKSNKEEEVCKHVLSQAHWKTCDTAVIAAKN